MARKKLKILLVEDNGIFLNLAEEILKDYNISTAVTVKEGIKSYKKVKPDIVFLDISLPDGSGYEILDAIKEINKDAFVVMLTASRLVDDIAESASKGAQGYIMKPFSSKRIEECITKYKKHVEKLKKAKEDEKV